ncbi:triose-phosphate isomerase [Sphingopyxis alaskensis]|jgi:triosephosphate isomerase|uniref:Triosephosphate isomerase n=1 Tax=Sphingopyxis alaskensis (strain DSM 13593 / LMG 18877 / RB2256) TaxID=317655 RepID=Q1GTY4_SPHAL|nr:triose-phosphate isomerase [Sphingopyxis alaskensis]ABF52888.1 triosephosphate isomerase [Sphingopyxis alaskensis RB2256]MCM3419595.1 triose-phosphate isomerase [Sphingopyxis alaskensis]
MTRRKYVVGNWKMNGLKEALGEARAIFAAADTHPGVDVALCPPFTLIGAMAAAAPGKAIGGQDCHSAASGAFTGSVAAPMLADVGASLVIVGHSERREGCGESDADVRAKAEAALAAGLSVILCVGEPRSVRESGGAIDHVLAQVAESVPDALDPQRFAIAYEPIWAIGTGLVPTVADVAAMHGAIRSALADRFGDAAQAIRILYGGSVNGDNAAELLDTGDVDGALVGGASLTAAKFVPIIEAAAGL